MHDNFLDPSEWRRSGSAEQMRLRAEFRAKEWFDKTVDVLRIWGLVWGAVLWIWVEWIDAEAGAGMQA
jgi:hypothetical protein